MPGNIEYRTNPNTGEIEEIVHQGYDLEEMAYILENEGTGYAIQHYTSGYKIADPVLAKMWDECKERMFAIEQYIEARTNPSQD